MSSEELSLFSYEILGLVGSSGAGAHDLLRLAQRGRILAWAGESQYYVEPKRLAKLGYLDARREPGKTRADGLPRTDKGREALREWAETPARVTPVKSDALLRMLIADIVGEGLTRASIPALREDIADLEARLDASEESADALPHPAQVPPARDRVPARPSCSAPTAERVEAELDPST